MFDKLIKIILVKSIAKDSVKLVMKKNSEKENIVKEKLGVESIDKFMRMDVHEYLKRG